jgi:hypothetical protein
MLYHSRLLTFKHEEEQADGKITESGAYLDKLMFPFAFPPPRGGFLKGYVLPFYCLFLTCKDEEEQAAGSISFA